MQRCESLALLLQAHEHFVDLAGHAVPPCLALAATL
jgi:hypothetical protein